MINENIKNIISKKEIVSFDIYDTLIYRLVPSPKDVFKITEDIWQNKSNKDLDFSSKRIEAAKIAAKKSKNDEVLLDDIYAEIKGISKNELNEIKGIEIEVEKCIVRKRYDVKEIYDYCCKIGKKIIIISDMYLPAEVIEEILSNNGYCNHDNIYISGTVGLSKSTGNIFDFVKDMENLSYDKWVHIGDNWKTDYFRPLQKGITPIHINKPPIGCKNGYIKNIFSKAEMKDFYSIGYVLYGAINYGFIRWLHEKIEEIKCDKILFLSRDGYYIKKAYDLVYGKEDSLYFLVSRRSLCVSWVTPETTLEDLYNVVFSVYPKDFSVDYCISHLNLTAYKNEILKRIENCGWSSTSTIKRDEILNGKKYVKLFEEMFPYILLEADSSKRSFEKYLKDNGIDNHTKLAIVDLGWRGSIQYMLEKTLRTNLYGLYLGIDREMFGLKYCQGYIANTFEEINGIQWYGALLEIVFSAPHGSVKRYSNRKGKDVVEMDEYEYDETPCDKYVNQIRKGMIDAVLMYKNDFIITNCSLNVYKLYKFFEKMFIKPSDFMVEAIGDLGIYDGKMYGLIPTAATLISIGSPKKILDSFINCRYKYGFLKKYFGFSSKKIFFFYSFVKNMKIMKVIKCR